MTERLDVCMDLPSSALVEPVPGLSRGILDRAPLVTRARPDVLPVRDKRNIQRARHGGRKLLVALRCFIPELMVEMRGPDQTDVARGVELAQDPREGDRIRSAGEGHDSARPRAEGRVLGTGP